MLLEGHQGLQGPAEDEDRDICPVETGAKEASPSGVVDCSRMTAVAVGGHRGTSPAEGAGTTEGCQGCLVPPHSLSFCSSF